MGQQPNIELDISDLPRQQPGPGIARSWRPNRPGDLHSPAEVPRGGKFGITGPNSGYALKLVGERRLKLLSGEHHHDVAAAVAAIASARAATRGRAPSAEDVDVAKIILALDPAAGDSGGPDSKRADWLANVGHDDPKLRRIVADIPTEILELTPAELTAKVAGGWEFRA